MKLSSILGLNARTLLFSYRYNSSRARSIAKSKLLTKKILRRAGIPVPDTYKIFKTPYDIENFSWEDLPASFVIKPSRGLGGEGIIVVKKKESKDSWVTTTRKRLTVDDLKLHTLDILEGAYALDDVPDYAFIEEYVGRHKVFRKYAYRGTPDIRIIVFNKIPTMAMLRLPTSESGGRANLHQGAIGVGVDIATGITTYGIWHGEPIKYKPGTKRKLHGIKIPHWDEILSLSVAASEVSGLGFLGADIVIHPEKGPMILELNSEPGLEIQLANQAGLRKRLERVEDIVVLDREHAVKIAKTLFTSYLPLQDRAEKAKIGVVEEIKIRAKDGRKVKVKAKIDTGAWRTAIDKKLAEELGLLEQHNVLWTRRVRSALGIEERPIISLTFWLAGRKIITPASVAKRTSLRYPVIVGRKDLKGMVIEPTVKL
jgi:alpha-L-glutamate ligase-like protein